MNKQIEQMARVICERDTDGDICTLDRKKCDCKCTSGSIAELLYDRGYRRQDEVAKEIFAEIEDMCVDIYGNFCFSVLAELKKKYGVTES